MLDIRIRELNPKPASATREGHKTMPMPTTRGYHMLVGIPIYPRLVGHAGRVDEKIIWVPV